MQYPIYTLQTEITDFNIDYDIFHNMVYEHMQFLLQFHKDDMAKFWNDKNFQDKLKSEYERNKKEHVKYWEVFASDCAINLFDQIIDDFYGAFMTFEDFKKESNLMCYEFTMWQPERGMKYWNTNEWANCLENTYQRGLKETKKGKPWKIVIAEAATLFSMMF